MGKIQKTCDACMLCHFNHVQLFATLRTVDRQAPLSMGFSRQEYWSGLPCPSPGDLPTPGTEPRFLALQVDSLPSEPLGKPYKCRQQTKIVISSIYDFVPNKNHRYFHNHLVGGYILKWSLYSSLCQQRSI